MKMFDPAYKTAEFEGTDWSSGKVRADLNNGGAQVGWNRDGGDLGEVIVTVSDCFADKAGPRSSVVLDKDEAMNLLNHLNELMGNPLAHPATAGGFAPSAD